MHLIPPDARTQGNMTVIPKSENLVPEPNKEFIPFGNYEMIRKIIESQRWFPVYVSGHSGCGKSECFRQACATLKRPYIRIQITAETNENELIGSMRMIDGNTAFHYGPVVEAMRAGAICNLDEIDMGSPDRLACLQSVMEGKPLYILKTNEYILPAPGFNVVATGNTKGQSDITGRYAGTRSQNESMLERFGVTFEQEYPTIDEERQILRKRFTSLGLEVVGDNDKYICNLTTWADTTRKLFREGSMLDLISTRRLLDISTAYSIYGDEFVAVNLCLGRFNKVTQQAFKDFFEKLQTKGEKSSIKPPPPAYPTEVTFTAQDLLEMPF